MKIGGFFKSPYQDKDYFLILFIFTLFKVIIFSMTIQAPDISGEGQFLNQLLFFISNTCILLLLLSFLFLFPQRIFQIIYGLFLYGSLSSFIIINRVYNLFFHSYISIETIISYVSTQTNMHSQKALSMAETLYNAMPFWDFLWIIDLPVIFYISYKYWLSKSSEIMPKNPLVFFKLVTANLLVILIIFNFYADPHYLKNVELKEKGLLTYYTYEAVSYLSTGKEEYPDYNDIEAIKRWFLQNKPKTHEVEYFGLARGKNLLVVQVEALQNNVINKRINGFEITPNLNRIIDESIYFENCYNQVEMATADAEALVNLSLYPLQDVCLYLTYPENTYNSLANQLKQEGYQTAVFHGFERNFYNREKAYPSMGFENYFSKEHFKQDEVHNLLLGDKTFLRQTAKRLNDLTAPYYAFIITLTSHHPFTFLDGYDAIDVGNFEGTIVGDYIKSIHYTDAAIGQFYTTLKREGILDETLMVLYGDHAAFNYNETDQDALSQWFGADMQELLEQIKANQVPLIIRLPGEEEPKLISDNAGMIDIYPTVANLLGLESEYLMGRDLLNTEEDIVILKGGSFIKGKNIFSALTYEQYNLDSEIIDVLTDDNELVQKVQEARRIAQLIYRTNFYGNQ